MSELVPKKTSHNNILRCNFYSTFIFGGWCNKEIRDNLIDEPKNSLVLKKED